MTTIAEAIADLRVGRGDVYTELVLAHYALLKAVSLAANAAAVGPDPIRNYEKGRDGTQHLDKGITLVCAAAGVDRDQVIEDMYRIEALEKAAA